MPFMTRLESVCGRFRPHRTVFERRFSARAQQESRVTDKYVIRCDACPVLCYIKEGRTGACDRYGNLAGQLVRLDPHVVLDRAVSRGDSVVPFRERSHGSDGKRIDGPGACIAANGGGCIFTDEKVCSFISSILANRIAMRTAATEGIRPQCGEG